MEKSTPNTEPTEQEFQAAPETTEEAPVEKPVDKPNETPDDNPNKTSGEKPVEPPIETLAETPAEVPLEICLNCETPLTGSYCSHCGQKNIPPRQTLGELLINFIASFWSFESKFLRTGRLLLFKPGQLARDYNAGKRERYYHPARMYVFISFIYFLLLMSLPTPDEPDSNKSKNMSEKFSREFSFEQFDSTLVAYKTIAQYDSVQRKLPPQSRDSYLTRLVREREIELNQRYKGKGKEFGEVFLGHFNGNAPKIFFLFLPVFALLLKLLYVRRDFFYSEHLVFSIYYYNFFFLAGSAYMLINQVPVINDFLSILGLLIVIYLLPAMKFMYKQSWPKTVFKYGIFIFIFSFCILIGLMLNGIISLMFI